MRVPGFLPDLPEVIEELAGYCTAARRLDDMVGAVLGELEAAHLGDDTIVIFLADNGMSMPFAKTSCYIEGTRTPLIIRWPGRVKKETTDYRHMISAVDFLPTILEAVDLPLPPSLDGESFMPILRGEEQSNRTAVVTEFHHIHGERPYPTRSMFTRDHAYFFNAWPDGKRRYRGASMSGITWEAMKSHAKTDPVMADRVHHLEYRTVEEFYDLQKDPYCLNNLLAKSQSEKLNPETDEHLRRLREDMRNWMVKHKDPILKAFDGRNSPQILEQWMRDYTAKARQKVEDLIPYEKVNSYRF